MKRLALSLLVLSLALGVVWVLRVQRVAGAPDPRGSPGSTAPAREVRVPLAGGPLPDPGDPLLAPGERVPVAPEDALPALAEALSGVVGRLVEADGRPVADQDVRLLELRVEQVMGLLSPEPAAYLAWSRTRAGELELEIDHDRTDRDGRFRLEGGRARALHALSGGGPRVPLRLIAEPLEPGALTDLGDVVLEPRVVLRGRVLDPAGLPCARASVRVGLLPEELRRFGLYELAPGCGLLMAYEGDSERGGGYADIGLLPPWLLTLLERLFLDRVQTDAEGRFEFADLPLLWREVDLSIDAPGFPRRLALGIALDAPADSAAPGVVDLGELQLEPGRVLVGRIEDADGLPVAGAELLAGPLLSDLSVLRPAGASAPDGSFRCEGLPARGRLALAARGDPLGPWRLLQLEDEQGALVLRLPALSTLVLRVVDDETGAPLLGARARLRARVSGPLGFLCPSDEPGRRLVGTGPGTFLLEDLPRGPYEVRADAPGHGGAVESLELGTAEREVLLRLSPARPLEVHVVDDGTGEPVAGAALSCFSSAREDVPLACARSGLDGSARFELPAGKASRRTQDSSGFLRVDHAAHATAYVPVEDGAGSVVVRLGAGARLRVSGPPRRLLYLTLEESDTGRHVDEPTQFLRLDASGQAALTHLTPGRWSWSLLAAWDADADLRALLMAEEVDDERQGELQLSAGNLTELQLPAARER